MKARVLMCDVIRQTFMTRATIRDLVLSKMSENTFFPFP